MSDSSKPSSDVDAVPTVALFCAPGTPPETAAPLAAAAEGRLAILAYDPAVIAAALARGQRAVLLWQSAREALAQALRAGQAPAAALADWETMASDLLALYRRNRRGLLLVCVDLLTEGSPADLDGLRTQLGLTAALPAAPAPGPDPLPRLLADLAVPRLGGRLRQVLTELQASSLAPLPADLAPEALDHAARTLQDQDEILALHQAQLQHLDGNVQSLLAEVVHQQGFTAETARLTTEFAAIGAQLAAETQRSLHLTAERDAARAELTKAQAAAQTEKARAAALTTERDAARAELAKAQTSTQAEKTRAAALTAERDTAHAELTKAQAATQAEKARATSLTAERDAARAELTKVQAATQAAAQAAAKAEKARTSEAVKAQTATQTEIAQQRQRLAAQDSELTLLRAQIEQLQAEADRHLTATAPDTAALHSLAQEGDRLREALMQSEKAVSRALAEARAEADRRARLEADLARSTASLQALHRQDQDLIAAQDTIRQLTGDSAGLLEALASGAAALAQLQAREAALVQDLAASSAQLAMLTEERDRMLASRSWRVTRPLRSAHRAIRPKPPEA
ncbi:hypothetical protein Q9299_19720 [Gemmobacter fulvus]|uniref:hypothetical protein n=1 Tax=Gemmobacter fulvus TaxID=2840474 RepID=UPI00279695AF|nr:hypothetical protein [Gemmobacter fulvus]MDQ1850538.1 hypothetical protein [Gemmobacter fulvus]